jgi:hypothetical protein
MELHLFLEMICVSLAITTLIFSYPLYLKNKDIHALFWMVCWGIWMAVLSLLHSTISIFCTSPDIFITKTGIFERILFTLLVMLCVYPGTSKEEKFLFLKKKNWIYLLIAISIYSIFLFALLPKTIFDSFIYGPIENYIVIIQLLIIGIVFGRLVDIVSKWAKILRWAIAGVLLNSVCSALSTNLYDPFFYTGHVFKIISYGFVLFSISYVWYKISIFNGSTLSQIINAHYGHHYKSSISI